MIPFYQIGVGDKFERMLKLVSAQNSSFCDDYFPVTHIPETWEGELHLNWYKVFHLREILMKHLARKERGLIALYDADVLICKRLNESEITPLFRNPWTCFAMTPTNRGGRNAGGMFVQVCELALCAVEEVIRLGLSTEYYPRLKPFAEQIIFEKVLTGVSCVDLPLKFNHYRNGLGYPISDPVIRAWHGYDYEISFQQILRQLQSQAT